MIALLARIDPNFCLRAALFVLALMAVKLGGLLAAVPFAALEYRLRHHPIPV